MEKIELEGEDLYLPTATNKLVKGIRVDSGIPLQSAAKVPIMITFNVVDRNGDHNDIKPQACIFYVSWFSSFIDIPIYELNPTITILNAYLKFNQFFFFFFFAGWYLSYMVFNAFLVTNFIIAQGEFFT